MAKSKAVQPKNIHESCDQQIDRLKKDVAARDKKIEALEQRFKDVEKAALDAVADYSRRFAEQQDKIKPNETARKAAEADLHLARTKYEKRLAELNKEHGVEFKKFRAEIEDLRCRVQASDTAKAKLVDEVSSLSKANDLWIEYSASLVAALSEAGVDVSADGDVLGGIAKLRESRDALAAAPKLAEAPPEEAADADQS